MILMTGTQSLDSFVQFITVLLIFLFVLVITYVVTRYISKFQKAQSTGVNMEVLDTLRISPSKYLQIVRTGEEYLVIAVCKDTITMLTKLTEQEIVVKPTSSSSERLDFKRILDKVITKEKQDKTKVEK